MKEKIILRTDGVFFSHSVVDDIPDNLAVSHCHDIYEILYVIQGNGKYIVEGGEYVIRPRTIMIIHPLSYHHLALESAVYERYLIQFSKSAVPSSVQRMLEKISEGDGSYGKYFSPSAVSDAVTSLYERFEIAETLPDEEKVAYIRTLLSELIILLSAASGEKMVHFVDEIGARVVRYLNQNITKDISLDQLAKRFFVSKYYLCRAFKKHNGISVHGYINYKRIMQAKQLIEAGETASGAAYKVGFGDYSAFYRAYVKIIGSSPTSEQVRKESYELSDT